MDGARKFVGMLLLGIAAVGCKATHPHHSNVFVAPPDMPRELSKVVLPTYTIEPPDILIIQAIHVVPRSPYLLRTVLESV